MKRGSFCPLTLDYLRPLLVTPLEDLPELPPEVDLELLLLLRIEGLLAVLLDELLPLLEVAIELLLLEEGLLAVLLEELRPWLEEVWLRFEDRL